MRCYFSCKPKDILSLMLWIIAFQFIKNWLRLLPLEQVEVKSLSESRKIIKSLHRLLPSPDMPAAHTREELSRSIVEM